MTQRLCCDVRRNIRATHVGLSVGHFIHSFHQHTKNLIWAKHRSGHWGVSSENDTVLPTSHQQVRGGAGGRRETDTGQRGALCAGETHGECGAQNGLPEGGEPGD